MVKRKNISLKKMYYGSFLAMIVIPILLIFGVALGAIVIMIRNAAISNIRSVQESIVDRLESDIKDVSLQLSHFVYVNSGEFMTLASGTDTDLVSQRYINEKKLDEAFQVALTPKEDIISMQFFMKDGKSTYLKEELVLPMEEVKSSKWYLQAMEQKNVVSVGAYDTSAKSLTYSTLRKGGLILAAALAPDTFLDRSERIELVSLFYRSDIGNLIQDYEKESLVGVTVILDENGELIYQGTAKERAQWYVDQAEKYENGVYSKRMKQHEQDGKKTLDYTYVVSAVSPNGWKVVNFIPTKSLTSGLNRFVIILLIVILVLFILFYFFSSYFLRNILTPVHNVVEGMALVRAGNLETHLEPEGQYEIRQMIHSFNRMVRRLKTLIEENKRVQDKKHEAEIKALQSQINPHFLVNTLNSIRFMAQVSKFEGIRRMAESLIRIVSCSFRSNISFYTLKEELEVLDSYLYLMKIRYSEGFDVEFHVEESCLDFLVPRLILQPLVENSIVHGFNGEDFGHLVITAKRDNHQLLLKVWDNGQGMTEDKIWKVFHREDQRENDNTSIGLENVIARLKLNFGEECQIEIQSEPEKFTEITLKLPIAEKEKNEKSTDCR